MRLLLAVAAFVALAFPATAMAGGWATVEVAPPPGGIDPGEPWRAEMLVKQHGITPLDDARPSILIDNGRGETQQFFAEHAGRPGTYVVDVTFPSEGTWKARVFDGWTDATPHRLAPIAVPTTGAPAPPAPPRAPDVPYVAAEPGGFPVEKAVAAGAMALIWLGLLLAVVGVRLPSVSVRGRGTSTAAG
jgi:hypothetical protein